MGGKVGESSRWKYMVLIKIEDVVRNFNVENQWVPSAVLMNGTSSQSTSKNRKFACGLRIPVINTAW